MLLLFVRHVESIKDTITEFGRKQLEMLEKEKLEFKCEKIYSSPVKRCVVTAKSLLKNNNVSFEIVEGISERCGLNHQKPKNKKEQDWYDNYLNPKFSSTQPEGCKEYLDRNFLALRNIINNHIEKNENIAIVAHSSTFYALMALLYGENKQGNIDWFRITPASKIYFEINEKV